MFDVLFELGLTVVACQNGYEYRHVGWSVWMRSVTQLGRSENDVIKAAKDTALACAFDALPMTEAVSVINSVLKRCIDNGWLCMVGCLIQSLRVPIIPIKDLIEFYTAPEVRYLKRAVGNFSVPWKATLKWQLLARRI